MVQTSLLSFFSPPARVGGQLSQWHAVSATPAVGVIPPRQPSSQPSSSTTGHEDATTSAPSPKSLASITTSNLIYPKPVDVPSEVPETVISRIQLLHLPALKRLTIGMLPVRYPDDFFTEVTHDTIPAELSRVALFENRPIGWIRCRLDPAPDQPSTLSLKPPPNQIYIQALCLIAPHRGQGIAASLLESISQPEVLDCYDVDSVYAHVWESSSDALEWYEKRGFKRVMLVESYYRKLKPGGAWIVRKELR